MSKKVKSRFATATQPPKDKPINFIHYAFYTLFFVTPLLLWPFTSEVFEFNKMMFVYAMTIVIGAGWAVKSLQEKRFDIARTPLDIPLLLFLSTQVISTIISIDRHTSLWGYYSRFHGGLASTICYIVLFYAYVTHFSGHAKAIKGTIIAILSTAVLTSVYAVLERLGIDKHIWVQDVQNRVFSTLGQPNWLSAYLAAVLPLSLFGIINTKNLNFRLLFISLSLLFLTAIAFTRSQSGIGATAVIVVAFAVLVTLRQKQKKYFFAVLAVLLLALVLKWSAVERTLTSLNKINPFFSDTVTIITEENKTRIGGSDSMAIRRVVWQGAIELGKKHPFFGTGVETFGYSYYWVRPAVHNLTSEADFLYNKAHNEYLNFLATTGFLGFFAYLFLIGSILHVIARSGSTKQSLLTETAQNLRSPLLLGFISILITNYFGFSVVNVALFFFLFPAIFLSLLDLARIKSIRTSFNQTFGIMLVLSLAGWLLLGVSRMWKADLAYTAGRNNLSKMEEAIRLNPREPLYYAQLGHVQALVAAQYIAPQIKEMPATASAEIKAKAEAYLNQYSEDAIQNVTKSVSMNQYNLNLLKTKARTELSLASIDPMHNTNAIQTLLKITELSPTEATNYYNIGILYSGIDKKEEAGLAFKKAIELKPDYQAAKDRLDLLD